MRLTASHVLLWIMCAAVLAWVASPPAATAAATSTAPGTQVLSSIACAPGTTSCVIVGSDDGHAMVESTDDGLTWIAGVLPPTTPESSTLSSVDCPATTSCVAAGAGAITSGTPQPLVETWDGASWHEVAPPDLPPGTHLRVSTCLSDTQCLLVSNRFGSGSAPEVHQVYNLSLAGVNPTWNLLTSFAPGARADASDVECFSTSHCVAVGYYDLGRMKARIWTWSGGSHWTRQTVAAPRGAPNQWWLNSVSCVRSLCRAVGVYQHLDHGSSHSLVEVSRHGGPWKIQRTPGDRRHVDDGLVHIECVSASYCLATGFRDFSRATLAPLHALFLTWDGAHWTRAGFETGVDPTLRGVAEDVTCPIAHACWSLDDNSHYPPNFFLGVFFVVTTIDHTVTGEQLVT